MNEIDHRAEAVRLARRAEDRVDHPFGSEGGADVFAKLAEVHARLAPPTPAEDQYWVQVHELEKLRKAVKDYLAEVGAGHKGAQQLTTLTVLVRDA